MVQGQSINFKLHVYTSHSEILITSRHIETGYLWLDKMFKVNLDLSVTLVL